MQNGDRKLLMEEIFPVYLSCMYDIFFSFLPMVDRALCTVRSVNSDGRSRSVYCALELRGLKSPTKTI